MEHITLEEYKQLQQKGNSKYKAKKTSIDGHTFDSQKEANYYEHLKFPPVYYTIDIYFQQCL